jgi:hypothetical protein
LSFKKTRRGRDPLFNPSIHKSPGFKITSFKTRKSDGRVFPSQPKLTMYYQVMVTHYPEGYDPYTVEYGIAERKMSDAQNTLMRARQEFPQSKAFIETIMLETSY